MPVLRFEAPDLLREWLMRAKSSTYDPADLLLGLVAREHGCETTLTFDRRVAASDLFRLL